MNTNSNPKVMYPVLYSPATLAPEKLYNLANGRTDFVRRMVICTEDAVSETELPDALVNIRRVLPSIEAGSPVDIFIRVRNPQVLGQILDMPDIGKITGIVVPKADPKGFLDYAQPVADSGLDFRLMPILESAQMTDSGYRKDLLDVMRVYRNSIDCLRIGGNDLLGHQGIRRDEYEHTIYETVVGHLIADIVNEFRGTGGFTVTAPVFECYQSAYDNLFRREVGRHIINGLFGQTVIHERHMRLLFDMYRVRQADHDSATVILSDDAPAVVGLNGRMDEKTTHYKWATVIDRRAQLFGVC